ncbi:hypothetical protein IQ07DRAFT_602098 [Pyrenochaeta sp. DS3sAY3a]|nr:hypothetical protein IQ07DRAFT_602098 [Pyrenochaeta sp. DS3sAY3a]
MRRLPVPLAGSAQPRALGGGQRQRARHMSAVRRGRRCDAGRVGRGEQRARDAAGFAVDCQCQCQCERQAAPGVVVRPAHTRRRWARKLAPERQGGAQARWENRGLLHVTAGHPKPLRPEPSPSLLGSAVHPKSAHAREGSAAAGSWPPASVASPSLSAASASWPACALLSPVDAPAHPLTTAPPTHRPAPMRRAAGDARRPLSAAAAFGALRSTQSGGSPCASRYGEPGSWRPSSSNPNPRPGDATSAHHSPAVAPVPVCFLPSVSPAPPAIPSILAALDLSPVDGCRPVARSSTLRLAHHCHAALTGRRWLAANARRAGHRSLCDEQFAPWVILGG